MALAHRLFELALLFKPLMQGAAVRRIAPKLVSLAILSTITIILASGVLFGSFYTLYVALTTYAFTELHALLATLGAAVALLLSCVLAVRWQLRKMNPVEALPAPDKIATIVDAFLEGLRRSPENK